MLTALKGQYTLFGGTPPHVDNETSRAAAQEIVPTVKHLQKIVLDCVKRSADYGVTSDDIERFTGLSGNTVRPRRRELEKMGLIVRTDRKRKTASKRLAVIFVAKGFE